MRNTSTFLTAIGLVFSWSVLVLAQEAEPELTGKPVLLRYGPGFDVLSAMVIRDNLIDNGCPATVTEERGLPKRVTVEIDGVVYGRYESAGSAGHVALTLCNAE